MSLAVATNGKGRKRGRPRSPRVEQSIIEAAIVLADERGYRRTTLAAVAQRAGVGKPALYRRWPGKAELFIDAYESLAPAVELEADAGSLAADLERLLTSLFETFRTTPAARILAGLIGEAQSDPAVAGILYDRLVIGRRGLLRAPITRAMARGEVPGGADADFLVDAIIGIIWHRVLLGRAPLDEIFARSIVGLVSGRHVE